MEAAELDARRNYELMSNRTFVCLDCRTSRREAAQGGLNHAIRCQSCGKPLRELGWRWRIPKRNNDAGWKLLERKVQRDADTWLPKRHQLGQLILEKIDREIASIARQRNSSEKNRRLRKLLHERRITVEKYIETRHCG